jgi:hypothetical protein
VKEFFYDFDCFKKGFNMIPPVIESKSAEKSALFVLKSRRNQTAVDFRGAPPEDDY